MQRPEYHTIKSAFPSSITLIVTARDQYSTYETSLQYPLLFHPAFVLRQHGEVLLGEAARMGVVEILLPANKPHHIVATSSDPAVVSVKEVRGVLLGRDMPDTLRFELSLVDGRQGFRPVEISFVNPVTEQREVLTVAYDAATSPDSRPPAPGVPTPPAGGITEPPALPRSRIDWLMLFTAVVALAGYLLFSRLSSWFYPVDANTYAGAYCLDP